MRYPPSWRHGVLVLSLGLAALPAWPDDDCDAPLNRWQSREAVRQMAEAKGWEIQRLKIDDGCYEIRATDAQGRTFKAKLDPETLKVLKMKQKQRDTPRERERDRDRDEDGASRQTRAPPSHSASAPSPASTPGTAPRRPIE